MKSKHLITAALGALLLSCQGPAAVLAQEGVADRPVGSGESSRPWPAADCRWRQAAAAGSARA
jgi:hypothetical protein